ncbi:MAG: hypothetical protein ACR2OV_15545 [Hyphomicrobiaceae bacterium]
MHIHTSNLPLRIGATLTGIGYAVVGLYAIAASSDAPNADLSDRALWLGITFLIASVLAIALSWLVADLSNIWCIPPRRTRPPPRLTLRDGAKTEKRGETDAGLSNKRRQA